MPGITEVFPSDWVTDKSTSVVKVSMSVELSFAELVSVTPLGAEMKTVLFIEPVTVGSIVPVRVMVMLSPEARVKPFQRPDTLL